MNFSNISYKHKMRKLLLQKNQKRKINSLNKQKHAYLIHNCLHEAFKGTVVNRALSSLHGIQCFESI